MNFKNLKKKKDGDWLKDLIEIRTKNKKMNLFKYAT